MHVIPHVVTIRDWHAGTMLSLDSTGAKSAHVRGMSSWPHHLQASRLFYMRLLSPGACAFSCWPLRLLQPAQLPHELPLWMRM